MIVNFYSHIVRDWTKEALILKGNFGLFRYRLFLLVCVLERLKSSFHVDLRITNFTHNFFADLCNFSHDDVISHMNTETFRRAKLGLKL